MINRTQLSYLFAVGALFCSSVSAAPYSERAEVKQFVDEMVREHDYPRQELEHVFRQAEYQQSIIDAITRPAEGKPWHEYRPIFLTQARIEGGVAFWEKNADTLARAEKEFGVPAAIIVAIIGVETRYGRFQGSYRVVDSLATLGFDYPPRGKFFRGQLKEYLIMAREEEFDPLELKGSYAGAMGKPQFIPSSFRNFAIDFDGSGQRDLWESNADVIGSVANYFKLHKWRNGEPVAVRAKVEGEKHRQLLDEGYKPSVKVADLAGLGVRYKEQLDPKLDTALIALEGKKGDEYWVALHNFYVITRYNHSPLYAMAVYQLSEAIRTTRKAQLAESR